MEHSIFWLTCRYSGIVLFICNYFYNVTFSHVILNERSEESPVTCLANSVLKDSSSLRSSE